MSDRSLASMLLLIVPEVVKLIVEGEGVSESAATKRFLESDTYALLEDAETDLWHLSPRSLFMMYEQEQSEGRIVFPEGVS